MNYKINFLKLLRGLSVLCFVGITMSGFFYPLTVLQGFVVNPLGLIACMALFAYSMCEHIDGKLATK